MKDPAFLFYPNDWIGGTLGMTFEEKGAYMELLMMQFNRGHMTEHMIGQVVGQVWGTIKSKFTKDPEGLWYNVRLENEQIKRKTYTESRRNNKSGVNQHTLKPEIEVGHMTTDMSGHMEDVNVNRDINKNKGRKLKKEDVLELPFLSEKFIENWEIIKRQPKWKKKSSDALQASLNTLKELTEDVAIQTIQYSITNGYQGIFPEKFTKSVQTLFPNQNVESKSRYKRPVG